MDTTHTRTEFVRAAVLAGAAATARRSRQMLIVLALALGVILLALSAPVVHAAPEDHQDTENPANVPPGQTAQVPSLQVHASENPVVCGVSQDWKPVAVTWTPDEWANFTITDDGQPVEVGWGWSKNLAVVCGHTFTVQVNYKAGDTWKSAPLLIITTKQVEIAPQPQPLPLPQPLPQPPEINPRLIPKLPDLALPTS